MACRPPVCEAQQVLVSDIMADPTQADPTRADPSQNVDSRVRIVAALLEPALALSRIARLSLDDVLELATVGYFRELQNRGLSWPAIGDRLGRSRRFVANVAKRARSQGIVGDSPRLALRRRLLTALAREGATDLPTLSEYLPDADENALRVEVEQLHSDGLLQFDGEAYMVDAAWFDGTGPEMEARYDSLRHFLAAVSNVVYRRFFTPQSKAEAFARILSFSVRPDDLAQIRERLYQQLLEAAIEADKLAEADLESVEASVALLVVETPKDVFFGPPRR